MRWAPPRVRPAFAPIDARYRRAGSATRLRRWLGSHDLSPERVIGYVVLVAALFGIVWTLSQAVGR